MKKSASHLHPNYFRFLTPPTPEDVDKVLRALNVNDLQFERFHNMSHRTLAKVRCGDRQVPVRFWHLFLDPPPVEKRVPSSVPAIPQEKRKKASSDQWTGII